METKEFIEKIYSERKDFILIGLTGRTGSGCSTSADILSTEDFKGLKLRQPKNGDYHNSDERKYKVLYKYAQENWNGFYVLSMSDVIFSFILENDYDDMYKIITSILTDWTVKPKDFNESLQKEVKRNKIRICKSIFNEITESYKDLKLNENEFFNSLENKYSNSKVNSMDNLMTIIYEVIKESDKDFKDEQKIFYNKIKNLCIQEEQLLFFEDLEELYNNTSKQILDFIEQKEYKKIIKNTMGYLKI